MNDMVKNLSEFLSATGFETPVHFAGAVITVLGVTWMLLVLAYLIYAGVVRKKDIAEDPLIKQMFVGMYIFLAGALISQLGSMAILPAILAGVFSAAVYYLGQRR